MPAPQPSEDPLNFMKRVLAHAKNHLDLSARAMENQEFETMEFTLRVVLDDVTTLLKYLNTLREAGYIKGLGVSRE